MRLDEIGEFALIERIRQLVDGERDGLVLGIGDDAAAFAGTGEELNLLASDVLVEGVHFNLDYFSFYQLGRRAMAINISDIAAMGGWPKYALTAVGLPPGLTEESVLELYRGMSAVAKEFGAAIVGGDTTRSPDRIWIGLTLLGRVEKSKMKTRAGARVDDAVFITGDLGASCAGLRILTTGDSALCDDSSECVERHLNPTPRVKEARFLVENFAVSSMIDVSDGLVSDLQHVCEQSQVGALLFEDEIPVYEETRSIAERFDEQWLDYALFGGEDFELLFTAPDRLAPQVERAFPNEFGVSCTKVGLVVDGPKSVVLRQSDGGGEKLLERRGYDHFAAG